MIFCSARVFVVEMLIVILLGAEAGNLALKLMAWEGVYLGGGIPPQNSKGVKEASFSESFRGQGPNATSP